MKIIKRLPLLVAGGVGYVLGTKAGRERYDQIREGFEKVRNDPRVQEKTQQAADFAKEQAPVVKDKVAEAASGAASTVSDKVGGNGAAAESTADLNPDRLKLGDDTGPKGDLP